MKQYHYHINFFYSENDQGYIADITDFKFCSAFDETPEEAVREIRLAKTAYIGATQAAGKPIPEPTYRSIIYQASVMPSKLTLA